jgi:hypothetical protein
MQVGGILETALYVSDIGCDLGLMSADRLARVQAGRRGGPAAGAVHLGEPRGVPHMPVDVHDDQDVGVGPGAYK